jgi:hypothetical protein
MEEVDEVDKRRFALGGVWPNVGRGAVETSQNVNFFQFSQSDLFVSGP